MGRPCDSEDSSNSNWNSFHAWALLKSAAMANTTAHSGPKSIISGHTTKSLNCKLLIFCNIGNNIRKDFLYYSNFEKNTVLEKKSYFLVWRKKMIFFLEL